MESMAMTKRASPPSGGSGSAGRLTRPWAHLSPDLLLDVSNRLDNAADFARFHAVCTPWRAAAPSLYSPAAPRPAFPSWLLATCGDHIVRSTVDVQCVTSNEDGLGYGDVKISEPQGAASSSSTGAGGRGNRNWVASADGTAAWLFVASPEPRLVHLLSGAVNPLPRFPDHDGEIPVPTKNVRGIVYRDGTIFLYSFLDEKTTSTFIAAILRPGDTAWAVMRRFMEVPAGRRPDASAAVYHDGEVVACVGYFWSLMAEGDSDGLAGLQSRWTQDEETKYFREHNYLLESRGELLWASILKLKSCGYYDDDLTSSLSLTVHALEKGPGGAMRWARRDGWSLADRVLFLGCPASFAADTHRLGMAGGCVYFVYNRCVFRYSLVDGEAQLVKQLRPKLGIHGTGVWLPRQPIITPIQEIRDGLSKQEARSL